MRPVFLVVFFLLSCPPLIGQKRFSEGTLAFTMVTGVDEKGSVAEARLLQSVKATHFRSELISKMGRTITLYDTREGNGAVLREYGQQKIMTPISRSNWAEIFRVFRSGNFNTSTEGKSILGYSCKRGIATLEDSTELEVFFTDELVSDNPDFYLQFKGLPGLALEYTTRRGNTKVTYSAASIDFDPVPIQKFDIPSSGYRILEFDESKAKRK